MCGICGQFDYVHRRAVDHSLIARMTDTLVSRGPDDVGYHFADGLGLGFRRLSIIDIEGGHQPMSDQDDTVWVLFNGEIYNFRELRSELEGVGYRFRTKSDTEVIVHGYRAWGLKILERLNGMFGLAIWDVARQQLVLARDAFGIKPLYYNLSQGRVAFGSEIRPVLLAMGESPRVDAGAVHHFLRYRYTPAPQTVYADVNKLSPGCMAIFEGGKAHFERWYRYTPRHFDPPKSDVQAEEELLELYNKAMARHLISDVPVGLLLSGGVDSGLLLALMNRYGEGWRTYTAGYGSTQYRDDELRDAAASAALFGASHQPVALDRNVFESQLSKIITALEEPVASSSIVPMYCVCARAAADVKVVLVGQGPDELFAGYTRHLGLRYGGYWRSMPGWLQRSVAGCIRALPRTEALKRGVYALSTQDPMQRYQRVFSLKPETALGALFRAGTLDADHADQVPPAWLEVQRYCGEMDELGQFQGLELRSSLADELLMFADKMSMAHSIEVRVPYLDRELVEYVECLPAHFKIRFGRRKWLHKRVAARLLPAEIIHRKKRGFAVDVVDHWFKESVDSRLADYLTDDKSIMYQVLDPQPIQRMLRDHQRGREDNHKLLYSLVVLEEWMRTTGVTYMSYSRRSTSRDIAA